MINFAAVIYAILGLLLLKQVLKRYFPPLVQYITLFFLFFGTNLFYYTVDDGSMSHVYSFFLFALFLYALTRYLDIRTYGWFLLMVFAGSVAVVTRPTNILIFALFFLWDLDSFRSFGQRILDFLKPVHLVTFIAVLFLAVLPQLLYWHYLHGTWISYSYGDEGFINWNQPYFAEVWLSPLNGLIPYVPMILLMVTGMIMMMVHKQFNGWVSLGFFLLVSYICASWETWYFGCSFGHRSFVEYFAIFAIPIGYLIQWSLHSRWLLIKIWVFGLAVLFSWFTLKLTYVYEKCFFGGAWDWNTYHRQLENAGIPFPGKATMDYQNGFENQALNEQNLISQEVVRSGMNSGSFDDDQEYCYMATRLLWHFPPEKIPETVEASCWVYYPDSLFRGARIVFSAELEGQSLFWEGKEILDQVRKADKWTRVSFGFALPGDLPKTTKLLVYIWNPRRLPFFVDDMEIMYLP